MTPGARIAAAIDICDAIAEGQAAEKALTRWSRQSRFAGSKDRAAVRDHVFDALRVWRLAAHLGGGKNGRARMLGVLRVQGIDPDAYFTGEGHSPAPLSGAESAFSAEQPSRGDRMNLPDWMVPLFDQSLGAEADHIAALLQQRAPVTMRVNTALQNVDNASKSLEENGIETRPNAVIRTALTAVSNARKITQSEAYLNGAVELQDAASQAAMAGLPEGGRVLDYCAGGGGKALALAMDKTRTVFAHDIDPGRMKDLPKRAERAQSHIRVLPTENLSQHAPFDTVVCDAPCTGSGTWRRTPAAKWTLTPQRLQELVEIQLDILDKSQELVAENGMLAYATCSIFEQENEAVLAAFLDRNPAWRQCYSRRFDLSEDCDGFFIAHLKRV